MAKQIWGKDISCENCKFFRGFKSGYIAVCKAYPDRIPFIILSGAVDHREHYKNDNGIQFELLEDIDA